MAILPAQACLHQCLWESSPFLTLLSTNFITNPVNRSGNRSCPSGVLVISRKTWFPGRGQALLRLVHCIYTPEVDLARLEEPPVNQLG